MILRGGKQLKGPKGVSQDEHLHDGNDVIVEKEVSTSSKDIIGDDAYNSNKVSKQNFLKTLGSTFTVPPKNGEG